MRVDRVAPLGVASVVLLVALLVHNLAWSVRNQLVLSCTSTVCESAHDLTPLARDSPYPEVSGRLAVYYALADAIGGATLIVPSSAAELAWELLHVARLAVVVDDDATRLDPSQVEALAGRATDTWDWLVRGGGRPRFRPLHLLADPAATAYVWAELGDGRGPIVVMPVAAR